MKMAIPRMSMLKNRNVEMEEEVESIEPDPWVVKCRCVGVAYSGEFSDKCSVSQGWNEYECSN
jgi:hypothetical protein